MPGRGFVIRASLTAGERCACALCRSFGRSAPPAIWLSFCAPLLVPSWGLRVAGSAFYSGRSVQRLSGLAGSGPRALRGHCGSERVGAQEPEKGVVEGPEVGSDVMKV